LQQHNRRLAESQPGTETTCEVCPEFYEIMISGVCLECGRPKGEPYLVTVIEEDYSYTYHSWRNPSGHRGWGYLSVR